MKRPPRRGTTKKKPLTDEDFVSLKSELQMLSSMAKYEGNPEHKKSPGDFGLKPPSAPRAGKNYCDPSGIKSRATAIKLLKEAFQKGLVDKRNNRDVWPKHVWAVYGDYVLEGKSSGRPGVYHGYPLQIEDPFSDTIKGIWSKR